MKPGNLLSILLPLALGWCAFPGAPRLAGGAVPVGVSIDWDTLQRKGHRGDNWCMTWASDDNVYTTMDDGTGFVRQPKEWNSIFYRISGGPDFTEADTWPCSGWPYTKAVGGFYSYGAYAVGDRIYSWLWRSDGNTYARPIANRLIYTDDFGRTFHRWDGTQVTEANAADADPGSFFFHREQPQAKAGKTAYAFNWLEFCQNGKANGAAKDSYVYMYAVEQYDVTRLSLLRVHKDRVTEKAAYEYLVSVAGDGTAAWSSRPEERGSTLVFPEKNYDSSDWLWCSWHPSVVYNAALDRYLMVSYGISDGGTNYWNGWCRPTSKLSATVGMWHAKDPWGPWTQFYYQPEWKTPGDPPATWGFDGKASRTYQFKLSPKWIEDNGRTLYLVWSDAGGRWDAGHYGHSDYWYRWNQVKITLRLEP